MIKICSYYTLINIFLQDSMHNVYYLYYIKSSQMFNHFFMSSVPLTSISFQGYHITQRGSQGLVVWRLPGMREVLGSNPLGTKTLCRFLLCSHFLSSKLLSHVCHSSQSLRAIVAKQGLKTHICLHHTVFGLKQSTDITVKEKRLVY